MVYTAVVGIGIEVPTYTTHCPSGYNNVISAVIIYIMYMAGNVFAIRGGGRVSATSERQMTSDIRSRANIIPTTLCIHGE